MMTRNYVYVSPDTDLLTSAKTMIKKKVGSLIIQEEGKLKGILTEKDIIWAIVKKSKKDLNKILAKDVMKKKVVTIRPSATLEEAFERMKKKGLRRLPVTENDSVIGMLTRKDILKIDPGVYEMITQTFKIKEETEKLRRKAEAFSRRMGTCQSCGNQGLLFEVDGESICEECYG